MWDFIVLGFPESLTVLWSNPGSRKYPSRPGGSELQTDPGSESLYPIIVYSVAKYRPDLSHFWENVILAIPT